MDEGEDGLSRSGLTGGFGIPWIRIAEGGEDVALQVENHGAADFVAAKEFGVEGVGVEVGEAGSARPTGALAVLVLVLGLGMVRARLARSAEATTGVLTTFTRGAAGSDGSEFAGVATEPIGALGELLIDVSLDIEAGEGEENRGEEGEGDGEDPDVPERQAETEGDRLLRHSMVP